MSQDQNKVESTSSQTVENQQPELKYSVQDVDNKINKVKEKYERNINENYVSKKDYEDLQKRVSEMELINNKSNLKNAFISQGGFEERFEDFYKASDINFKEDLNTQVANVKKTKDYFFKSKPLNVFNNTGELTKKEESYVD